MEGGVGLGLPGQNWPRRWQRLAKVASEAVANRRFLDSGSGRLHLYPSQNLLPQMVAGK